MIKVKKLHPEAQLPTYQHSTDDGADIMATERQYFMNSKGVHCVRYKLGIAIEPDDNVAKIFLVPRSSCTTKSDLTPSNHPEDCGEYVFPRHTGDAHLKLANKFGLIDRGFRGELSLVFHGVNKPADSRHSHLHYDVGDRVGQLVIVTKDGSRAEFEIAEELKDSDRGEDGFGSTGNKSPKAVHKGGNVSTKYREATSKVFSDIREEE